MVIYKTGRSAELEARAVVPEEVAARRDGAEGQRQRHSIQTSRAQTRQQI